MDNTRGPMNFENCYPNKDYCDALGLDYNKISN